MGRAVAAAVDLHLRQAEAAGLRTQDVHHGRALAFAIDGVEVGGGRRSRLHGGAEQVARKADHGAVGGGYAGAPREIGGEDRTRERDVGDRFAERVGDDRRLDAARERSPAAVVSQLEPPGVANCRGEALDAPAVLEVDDRPRSELTRQLAGGAPKLGLLGGVAGVHR